MDQKRALIIQDMSLVGRCSLTAALPLFSALGIEAVALPTALLSSHTGGFGPVHRRDLSQDMALTLAHWAKIPLHFDLIHVGYLAGAQQLKSVMEAADRYKAEGTLLVVDPVMGDWGKTYSFVDEALLHGFRDLVAMADLILPNRTEAALLLDIPYQKGADSPQALLSTLTALRAMGAGAAMITGVSAGDGHIGAAWLTKDMDSPSLTFAPEAKGAWPGTGDLFAAVLEGALLRGMAMDKAAALAVQFVHRCVKDADSDPKIARFGLPFEKQIPWLIDSVSQKGS